MSVFGRPPYAVKLDDQGGVAGTDAEAIEIIAKKMKFKLEARLVDDWWKFRELPDGTYYEYGSMADVAYGRVHFAGAELFLLHNIWYFFDFMFHMNTDPRLFTGKPKVLPPYLNIFRPFSNEAWLGFGITMLVASIAFMFLTYHYGYKDFFTSFISFFMHPFGHGKYLKHAVHYSFMAVDICSTAGETNLEQGCY